jgi:hypothetical protein
MADANVQNAKKLSEFISIEISEHNLKLSSGLTKIKILCLFSRYLDYKRFQLITKDDIGYYLNSLKSERTRRTNGLALITRDRWSLANFLSGCTTIKMNQIPANE